MRADDEALGVGGQSVGERAAVVTRAQIDAANPETVLGMLRSWKRSAASMVSAAESYEASMRRPGGQPWSGETANAAIAMAGQDVTAVENMRTAIDAMADAAINSINEPVILNVKDVRDQIASAEAAGFTVHDDLSLTYPYSSPPDVKKKEDAERRATDIQNAATRWWNSDQAVADQINRDKQGLAANFSALGGLNAAEGRGDSLFEQDRFLGNQGGIPIVDRDRYNRLHLDVLQQDAQADVARLQARVDELGRSAYMGEHRPGTVDEVAALAPQLAAARHQLDGYKAVRGALESHDGVPRYLTYLDDQGRAAVAMGNPDTATHTATLVPGTGQDLTTFEGASQKSAAMYDAALKANDSLSGKLAVTTWMGYDRPMDLFQAASQDYARDGAGALDSYLAGVQDSHTGAGSLGTVIGHSYGSTLVGAAGSDSHHLAAENVIAVGSPGMLVGHASELSVDPGGQVYASRAQRDIIHLVAGAVLGPNPTWDGFGAVELFAAPGAATGPEIFNLPSVAAHSSYWDPGNPALVNMGAVIAGQAPPQIVPNG